MPGLAAIHHVAITVTDLERTVPPVTANYWG
jgi:hypothetical protein